MSHVELYWCNEMMCGCHDTIINQKKTQYANTRGKRDIDKPVQF